MKLSILPPSLTSADAGAAAGAGDWYAGALADAGWLKISNADGDGAGDGDWYAGALAGADCSAYSKISNGDVPAGGAGDGTGDGDSTGDGTALGP